MRVVLSVMFVFSALFSYDECSTAIYFGNGMNNSEDDVKDSKEALSHVAFQLKSLHPELEVHGVRFDNAYNHKEDFALQLYEVISQWYAQYQITFTTSYPIQQIMGHLERPYAPEFWKEGDEAWLKLREEIRDFIRTKGSEAYYSDEDLARHVDTYIKARSDGEGVVLAAHSQGNFYGNLAFGKLDERYQEGFEMVSIATPAAYVAKGGAYTTNTTDVISHVIGALPANVDNGVYEVGMDGYGHNFITGYLLGAETRAKIINDLDQAISTTQKSPSQWIIIDETGKNTCEHRVTVQNRIDKRIISDVMPFDKEGKLYEIDGQYLLGPCEGIGIETVEEDPNICYRLRGTSLSIKKQTECSDVRYQEPQSVQLFYANTNISDLSYPKCTKIKVNGETHLLTERFSFPPAPALYQYTHTSAFGMEIYAIHTTHSYSSIGYAIGGSYTGARCPTPDHPDRLCPPPKSRMEVFYPEY